MQLQHNSRKVPSDFEGAAFLPRLQREATADGVDPELRPLSAFADKPARGQRVSDRALIAAYRRYGNVHKAGKALGIGGGSLQERLVRLGEKRSWSAFTQAENDRLAKEYNLAADAGKLADLAASMGRHKTNLCRQARALGLTAPNRKRVYISTWKYVTEEYALPIFEHFKKSRKGMTQYCKWKGYDDLGFSRCMKKYFGDEWDHVLELKTPKQSLYRLGRALEYRVRDELRAGKYFVTRSPASKSPVDLVAIRPGHVYLIQCKRHGQLPVIEWNALFELARSCGAVPILASQSETGRGIVYEVLTALKDGSKRRQPKQQVTL
jgi:hypothetical protein